MTEPAALQADYRIIKPVAGRSCYILQLEVPWEAFDEVNRVLGAPPKPGENRWVGVALLNPERLVTPAPAVASAASLEKPSKLKGEHGDYAAKLYKSYFMRNEEVCKALGTTDQFKAWIQKQPSAVSDQQDYCGMETGEMKCEESHVERVFAGSGKAIKADYHSVPLTRAEHKIRHGINGGELAVIETWGAAVAKTVGEPEERLRQAKEWFEKKAMEYREMWVREMLLKQIPKVEVLEKIASFDGTGGSIKERVGRYASLADIPPSDIQKWAEEKGLTKYLPKSDLTE